MEYIVLIEKDGTLSWEFRKQLPMGTVLDAAGVLADIARRQVLGPAPVPQIVEELQIDDKDDD